MEKNNIISDWLDQYGDSEIDKFVENKLNQNKMKEQETLEEAAKKYATNHGMMAYVFPEREKSFIDGAKWQQEQMEQLKDFETWKEWKNKQQ